MGQSSLDRGEEADDYKSKDGPGAKLLPPEGVGDREWIEQDERSCRDEKDPEVIPPVRDVLFDLMSGALQDVEAEVFSEKAGAEPVNHVDVPGQDCGEEEEETEPEVLAEAS